MFEATLHSIAERLRAHAGLRPPSWVLGARVRERMRALDVGPDEYLGRLAGEELDALVEALRVGETRFFRHQAHVAALRRVVVPAIAAERAASRRVRAWSAGCASGEEAYTLAMILVEGLPGWEVAVLATDISDEALAVARAAVYSDEALAPVPSSVRSRWFRAAGSGRVTIVPELAARVRFERRNLVDPFAGDKDVILCRNVLIYFDADTRAATARRLVEALAPGGFLFLGYAETLRVAAPGLEARSEGDGIVYRKLARAATPPVVAAPAAPRPPGPAPAPRPAVVRVVGSHEGPDELALELRAGIEAAAEALVVDLDGAEYLDDSVATVLRRAEAAAASAGVRFVLAATRVGPRRWLERHGFTVGALP